jgi:penicillin-binding protein-related factor A (putative recombinase)
MSANSYKAEETALVASFIQYLKLIGCVALRINSGMTFIEGKDGRKRVIKGAPKGTSDIIGCYRGRFFAIEAKVAPNVATPDQLEFLEDVRMAGGLGCVAYSVEDIQKLLQPDQW